MEIDHLIPDVNRDGVGALAHLQTQAAIKRDHRFGVLHGQGDVIVAADASGLLCPRLAGGRRGDSAGEELSSRFHAVPKTDLTSWICAACRRAWPAINTMNSAPFNGPNRGCSRASQCRSLARSWVKRIVRSRAAWNWSNASARLEKRPVGLTGSGASAFVVRFGTRTANSASFSLSTRGDSRRGAASNLPRNLSSTTVTCSTHSKTDHRPGSGLALACSSLTSAAAA